MIIRTFSRDERGSISLLTAASLIALVGFIGLAVDIGSLRLGKQRLQMAADAAALAGALELSYCGSTANCAALQAAAQNALTENGLTGSTLLVNCAAASKTVFTITVNNGPCTLGSANPDNGNTSVVEVVVSQPQKTYFESLLGIKTVLVNARSEASLAPSPTCVYALNPSGTGILLNGSAAMTISGCGVVVDSNSSSAMMVNGSTTGASSIGVVGTIVKNGGATVSPTPTTGIKAVSDPLASLAAPSFSPASCLANPTLSSGTHTLGPAISGGTVCYDGLTIQNSATVTLNPGLYILNGNLMLGGTGSITGTNVTFYFPANNSYTDNGGQKITLSAPLNGTYNGILIYEDRSNSSSIILNGGGTSSYQGVIYARAASLTMNSSSSGATLFTSLVVGSLALNTSATFQNYSTINSNTPLTAGAVISQ
jgi:Flp pilus assembly protein TadG